CAYNVWGLLYAFRRNASWVAPAAGRGAMCGRGGASRQGRIRPTRWTRLIIGWRHTRTFIPAPGKCTFHPIPRQMHSGNPGILPGKSVLHGASVGSEYIESLPPHLFYDMKMHRNLPAIRTAFQRVFAVS